jgi:branched-chain amino acid transport system ATP-binding protein
MLSVSDIHCFYGDAHILHGISLAVARSSVVSVLGRNGAGKSTTLKSIMGIVPARSGSIAYDGKDITRLPCEEIARLGIAYIPEERGIISNLTVRENLRLGELGSSVRGRTTERYALAFEYFPALAAMVNRLGGLLSGGEQQMLAFARALVASPSLILVDEPTEGLSPMVVDMLVGAMQRIRTQGVAVLLVEQNLEVAMMLSDYLYVIDQGHIRFEGKPELLGADEVLQQDLLGV